MVKPVLGIVRKSPTKDPKESINLQKKKIAERVDADYTAGIIKSNGIIWAVDVCSGDDEENRTELLNALKDKTKYSRAYCLNTDRFSRSWLGIKWFELHFIDGLELHFVEGMPPLYDEKGNVQEDNFLFFFMSCGFALWELMKIRRRTQAGREKLSADEWRKKYPGRQKGAKNRKRKVKI